MNSRYKVTTNSILSSRRYFETNTILPEYGDYEALAGAAMENGLLTINGKLIHSVHLNGEGFKNERDIVMANVQRI